MPDASTYLRLAALLLILAIAGCGRQPKPEVSPQPSSGIPPRSALSISVADGLDTEALEAMRWDDIALTSQSIIEQRVSEKVLDATASTTSPPVLYLRGILLLAKGQEDEAAAAWNAIDISAFSPDALYPPWRVASERRASPNRYDEPLAAAVNAKQASPLVRARFHGLRGEWQPALDDYLLTDPSTWTPFDIRIFGMLRLQAGFSRDTAVMLAGALAGGRVPASLRVETARLVKETPLPDEKAVMQRMQDDPEFAAAATRAAEQMLSLREAFLANRFQQIVDNLRSTDPMQASDEAVYLAFLSSAQVRDAESTEKWGGELLRRNPDAGTQKWIESIKKESR